MDAVVAHGSESIRKGSKSFAAAARLFRPDVRDDAVMLYAWCRHCDDVIDGQSLGFRTEAEIPHDPQRALALLVHQTEAAIAGRPQDDPVFEALARVVRRHDIPARHPLDLLKGFEMDVEARRYDSFEDVLDYCYHVAGVVGVMMTMIMGARAPETLRRAQDLGLAFQLTNIARDVGDDARMGRVYLPRDWLAEVGIPAEASPMTVAAPENAQRVARVVASLLAAAEPYYASARIGLRDLPFRSAWAIAAARGIYRDIGREVLRRGPDAYRTRVSTGTGRKILWALRGGVQAASARSVERLRPAAPRGDLWTVPHLRD